MITEHNIAVGLIVTLIIVLIPLIIVVFGFILTGIILIIGEMFAGYIKLNIKAIKWVRNLWKDDNNGTKKNN